MDTISVRPHSTSLRALVATLAALAALGSWAAQAAARPITKPRWLSRVTVTEYFPVPERWFRGVPVPAPGLPGAHRVDWLYGPRGLSMEGTGVGLDGRLYHIDALGRAGWVNAAGAATAPGAHGWTNGPPAWRAGALWTNAQGAVTFPLLSGGWANGPGRDYRPLPGVSFASGPGRRLGYYRSVAVDPRLIPLGSRVYIPAYGLINGGWFIAQDVGGGIISRHVDVFRPPPGSPTSGLNSLSQQLVYVIPPR